MIIVDTREPPQYQAIGDVVEYMKYGDFLIKVNNDEFICERKTPVDFWTSLKSGRLNNQLSGSHALILDCHEYGMDLEKYFKFSDEKFTIERFLDSLNGVSLHHNILIVLNIPHLQRMLRRYEEKKIKGTFGRMTT